MSCLAELVRNQLLDVPEENRLRLTDMERLAKFSDGHSYFDPVRSTLFVGYVNKNRPQDTCITFFFRKKKVALHRLLFQNYLGELTFRHYVRHLCGHRYSCVNILHLRRNDYVNKKTPPKEPVKTMVFKSEPKKEPEHPPISLTIHFD